MSHLHIPDGVLPPWVWLPGLLIALLLLLGSARRPGAGARRQLGYQGALGALVLAAMAVEIPLGPLDYHLSLVGPVGVLLGPAASYQVLFVASAILAFAGHGGFTVIGLNALVLGAGAAIARPIYRRLARRWSVPASLAASTTLSQALSGALWLAVVAVGLRIHPGFATGHGAGAGRLGLFGGVAIPLWVLGIAVESVVAFGIGRFLARVRPDLLPGSWPAEVSVGGAA